VNDKENMSGTSMIESAIDLVIATGTLSAGDDLLGFLIDAEYTLEMAERFSTINVTRSEEPRSLLSIELQPNEKTESIQQIRDAVLQVMSLLEYIGVSAHSYKWYRDVSVVRFVMCTDDLELCVTGTITVTGPRYRELATKFEKTFSLLPLSS
jgi:hypothetical protein